MSDSDSVVRPSRRRWPWLLGVPVLFVLAVALLMWGYSRRMSKGRLADAIAAADRDDPNWRLDDLMAHREPVPDAENSALIVAKVLSLLPDYWPSGPKPQSGVVGPPLPPLNKAYDRMTATARQRPAGRRDGRVAARRAEMRDEAVQMARTIADLSRGRHELKIGPYRRRHPAAGDASSPERGAAAGRGRGDPSARR